MAVTEDIKARKHNLKLYPKYLMLGYDLLFYYGIRVMFLINDKGITDSQILLAATVICHIYDSDAGSSYIINIKNWLQKYSYCWKYIE